MPTLGLSSPFLKANPGTFTKPPDAMIARYLAESSVSTFSPLDCSIGIWFWPATTSVTVVGTPASFKGASCFPSGSNNPLEAVCAKILPGTKTIIAKPATKLDLRAIRITKPIFSATSKYLIRHSLYQAFWARSKQHGNQNHTLSKINRVNPTKFSPVTPGTTLFG